LHFTLLENLINVDLEKCEETQGMRLVLQFRIHKASNVEQYADLVSRHGGSSLYQDDENFPLIQLEFDSFIGYSVLNECYTVWDDYEQFHGKIFRIYQKSRYLDFITLGTIATDEHPGPFKHYRIAGLNHIVDIVSTSEPTLRI
jgi:hypothetical protein